VVDNMEEEVAGIKEEVAGIKEEAVVTMEEEEVDIKEEAVDIKEEAVDIIKIDFLIPQSLINQIKIFLLKIKLSFSKKWKLAIFF
jgi:hypothetical protein